MDTVGDAYIDTTNVYAQTALMLAAEREGGHRCVAMLLQARASINKADLTGETALIKAARMGNLQTVSLLLSSGARADIKDNNSFTALLRAAYEGHRDTVKVLLGMM